MSVYIPGMEMPDRCFACPMFYFEDGEGDCRKTIYGGSALEYRKVDIEIAIDTRPDWCHLIPVPYHGRLIDADAAKELMKPVDSIRDYEPEWTWGELYESNCNILDSLPTIIPADPVKEGNSDVE